MIVCVVLYHLDCVYESYTFYFQELFAWVQEHGLWPEEGVETEP